MPKTNSKAASVPSAKVPKKNVEETKDTSPVSDDSKTSSTTAPSSNAPTIPSSPAQLNSSGQGTPEGGSGYPVQATPVPLPPLPNGWQEARDQQGRVYYIDHINKQSHWTHPYYLQVYNQGPNPQISQGVATPHTPQSPYPAQYPPQHHGPYQPSNQYYPQPQPYPNNQPYYPQPQPQPYPYNQGHGQQERPQEKVAPSGPPLRADVDLLNDTAFLTSPTLRKKEAADTKLLETEKSYGCGDACSETLAANKCLSVMSIILYLCLLGAGATAFMGILGVTAILLYVVIAVYLFYFFIFVCAGGCIPGSPCCKGGGPCLNDKIHEFLDEDPISLSDLSCDLDQCQKAPPRVTVHLKCYHMSDEKKKSQGAGFSIGDVKIDLGGGGGGGHTMNAKRKEPPKEVVTFQDSVDIPVANFKDISIKSDSYVSMLRKTGNRHLSVRVIDDVSIHPTHLAFLDVFESKYKSANRDRDTRIQVWHDKGVYGEDMKSLQIRHVIVDDDDDNNNKNNNNNNSNNKVNEGSRLVHRSSGDSCFIGCCLNSCTLFLCMYLAMYLPYLCVWRCLVRPFTYHRRKVCTLDTRRPVPGENRQKEKKGMGLSVNLGGIKLSV